MPVIRNKLSSLYAGGPRQFAELQDRLLVAVQDREDLQEARSELDKLGLATSPLKNAPVITAEAEDGIEEVLDRAREIGEDTRKVRQGIREIANSDEGTEAVMEATDTVLAATRNFMNQVQAISVIDIAEFVRTEADYGPENLRIDVQQKESLGSSKARNADGNMNEVYKELDIFKAWSETRGENAIACIFDTGFAKDLISDGRTKATFHGGGTDNVYKASEGHGTMTAGAMAASTDEDVPFDGVMPDAEVILVRITDDKGQIRSDIISQAWDWLADLDTSKPIIANHSYGTPLCSGRPRTKFCDTAINRVIQRVASDKMITPVYAAGNEAMRCGHRPSGITNAITGTNSLEDVITVGALLTNGREAQRYSSHGRGDCAPIADPKPNVSMRLPMITYYGAEGGYKLKDMSTGPLGSGGGTSHAAPTVAGMIGLLQSKAFAEGGEEGILETEEVKQIIERTAKLPRTTQINRFGFVLSQRGYDARFGNGEVQILEALKEV